MSALSSGLRSELERAVVAGRGVAEEGVRAALSTLGVFENTKPSHLDDDQARLRRGLRAKQRQLGGGREVLVWDAGYEQWHRLLFARFLAERGLLRHPSFDAPVTLADCDELAAGLGEPDGWSVAGRFAAEILPGIFRLDDPCVQLRLAPEHRQRLQQIVTGLPAEMFVADDSLGWVYQYWQSERKDQVNASESKIGGADLGPVTQLFTENYMVRFLLENSLGAWWAARHPESPLLDGFEFLRFDEETGEPAAGAFEQWPDSVAEVTVMDPCCGSGHFLVEAFKMLWAMRAEEEQLDRVAAQDAVLEENLFGLELDPRCVQIAMFAVALQAWTDGGGWRQLPTPNIACSGVPAKAPLEEWTALANGDPRLEGALERLHGLFKDADTLGSLIDPKRATEGDNAQPTLDAVDFGDVAPLLQRAAARETDDPATAVLGADAAGIAHAADLLARSFVLVATNVPFLGINKHSETLRDRLWTFTDGRQQDLAYAMVGRCNGMTIKSGAVSVVTPSEWLFSPRVTSWRKKWLACDDVSIIARLGYGAFSSGVRANPLLVLSTPNAQPKGSFRFLDVPESASSVDRVRSSIRTSAMTILDQRQQHSNPESVVSPGLTGGQPLGEITECRWGLSAGDGNRFERFFWEVEQLGTTWEYLQTSSGSEDPFGGRSNIVRWEQEQGQMAALAESVKHLNHKAQQWRSGKPFWGHSGVAINTMGNLRVSRYEGDRYSATAMVIVPADPNVVGPLWKFARSGELESRIREISRSLSISPGTIEKVPFDVERWRAVAEEEYPDGLPEPWSDDPTQWLFEGDPAVATEPLEVAVGRLVGYRWPEQPDDDGLNNLADDDGIVCLPAVGGEQPAAERLEELLAAAFGDDWGPNSVRRLLEQAGSKRKTLGDWLANDFFKHHCSVFSNRPFVWHVSDEQAGGFSALVNYHKLDRAGLEKLTYAYLGDWIERQAAAVNDGTAGADTRLAAAQELKEKLQLILEGEPPFDIFVRWKQLHEQPIGWDPDLDDGVRLNIRPFMTADVLAGPKSVPRVHWKKDRGKNPDGSLRHNDLHHTNDEKRQARQEAGS